MYVKAFRWASDRIGDQGIVAFITNNGFLNGKAFDGMRLNLLSDYDTVYHLDFKGNARTSERRQRREGNIFADQIRVGFGITFLLRKPKSAEVSGGVVNLWSVDDYEDAPTKAAVLEEFGSIRNVHWIQKRPHLGDV